MDIEMKDELNVMAERLAAATGLLEQTVERLAQRPSAVVEDSEARIGRIVATVDVRREAELEERLAAAESVIAELQARGAGSAAVQAGRKTLPTTSPSLFTRQAATLESIDAGAIDAALVSLSLEQRIAVKAQLLRAGLLG